MRIADLVGSEQELSAYRAWKNDPRTKAYINLARMEGRPRRTPVTVNFTGELAALLYGESGGWFDALERLESLDETVDQQEDPNRPVYGEDKGDAP